MPIVNEQAKGQEVTAQQSLDAATKRLALDDRHRIEAESNYRMHYEYANVVLVARYRI